MPWRVQSRTRGRNGAPVESTYRDLQWNDPIPDEMFEVPKAEGWTVLESAYVYFSRTRLKEGVRLTIGLDGEGPVITERDVREVNGGYTSFDARDMARIEFTLTQEAIERFRGFVADRLGTVLIVRWNDEGPSAATISIDMAQGPRPDRLSFWIPLEGRTLQEFESEFLTRGPAQAGQ